jgi:Lecithin:cholesterol acyltransferase
MIQVKIAKPNGFCDRGTFMSTYEQKRDDEYLNRFYCPFSDFIKRYNANLSSTHKTIFLFPGGLGSQLLRATADFNQGPLFLYLPAWIDPLLPSGTAINLQTQTPPDYDDYQRHFIVPYGCIDCPPFLRPYAGFINWCQSSNIDLFVFGWDWRRSSEAAANFFLNRFLPAFDAYATIGARPPHPLDNFWLVGHSFGGMVVKQILNQATNAYVQRMQRAITVGSPFYGYGGQVHRFFKGDELLNATLNPNGAQRVTEIVSSLPGGYELLFLSEATYDNNQTAFASDPDGYNLMSYPSMDADNPAERADPYNPIPIPPATNPTGYVRYISSHGFDMNLLAAGKIASDKVTQPLVPSVLKKFYNIRGVGNNNTVVSQTWKRVLPTFNPDYDTDPIIDTMGPGDGLLPAWSTRLLGMYEKHVISIGGSIEHMDMMNEVAVQIEIGKLLQPSPLALKHMSLMAKRNSVKINAASRAELNKLIRQLAAISSKEDLSTEQRDATIRKLLQKYSPQELQKFMARAYLDALKSPSQVPGASGRGRGKKPSRGAKRKRVKRKR